MKEQTTLNTSLSELPIAHDESNMNKKGSSMNFVVYTAIYVV